MKRRDIVIGLLLLVALAAFIYYRQRTSVEEEMRVPETLSSEQVFEERFNLEIPDDADKAELKDIDGGSGSGIAIKKFEDNKFTHSLLVDLPDPEPGYFYQGWLAKGDEGTDDYSILSTGKLQLAKGGWMLDFTSSGNLEDYGKVVVSLEKVFDNVLEEKVLEGGF